jgi:hypothetical protein
MIKNNYIALKFFTSNDWQLLKSNPKKLKFMHPNLKNSAY